MNSTSPITATTARSVERVIPLVEEQVKVARRTVETGRATRVRKVVREHRQELELPVTHEEVHVERVPVGRPVDGPLGTWEDGDVLVIPVVEERLVVRTEHVLREEIRITRRRRTEPSVHAVTLQREVAIVERLDPATGEWQEIDAPRRGTSEPADEPGARHDAAPPPETPAETAAPAEAGAPAEATSDDRHTVNPGPHPQGASPCTP